MSEAMEHKNARNARVQARYDALMAKGKHGHYETMFRVVREELDRAHGGENLLENVSWLRGALFGVVAMTGKQIVIRLGAVQELDNQGYSLRYEYAEDMRTLRLSVEQPE
jgi:hypothetical protein